MSWLIGSQLATLAVGLWMCGQLEHALGQRTVAAAGVAQVVAGPPTFLEKHAPAALCFVWIAVLQGLSLWLHESRARRARIAAETHFQIRQSKLHADVVRLRDAIIFGLAKLAESRDTDTGHHLERIAAYSTRLAQVLRRIPEFADRVTAPFVQDIGVSSALHDIGKVAVEDAILLKPGALTNEERERMQIHAAVGAQCIEQIGRRLGDANFLELAHEIALHHHERWDGTGYPSGLREAEIPLAARIVAIADVYDALSARRVYKAAFSHDKCVQIIREEAGRHFDPKLVEVFLSIEGDFLRIRQRYSESDVSPQSGGGRGQRREHAESLMTAELEQRLLETVGPPEALSAAEIPVHSPS